MKKLTKQTSSCQNSDLEINKKRHERLHLTSDLAQELRQTERPCKLGFANFPLPILVESSYTNAQWSSPRLIRQEPLFLSPLAGGLHYGQLIFEGMKAFQNKTNKKLYLFRPMDHWRRFNQSAEFMSMPRISAEHFLLSLESLVQHACDFIGPEKGASLYLRPLMIASEPSLSVSACEEYRFMVMVSPSNRYFAGSLEVMIEREMTRTAPGGTGRVKCAGNYAPTFRASKKAAAAGFKEVLFLDACTKRYIEELSAMNFFCIDERACLITPPLSDTILAGITRDSILKLAHELGLEVREEPIEITDLIEKIKLGQVREAFACGTGASVVAIESIGESSGLRFKLKKPLDSFTNKIRELLLTIQEGDIHRHDLNWQWPVEIHPCRDSQALSQGHSFEKAAVSVC